MPVEISYSKPTCVLYCKMQFGCAGIVVIVPNPKGKLIGSKWQFGQQIDNGTALVVVGTGLEVFVENDGLVVVVVEYQYQVVTNAVAGGVDAGGIFQVGIEHRPLTGRVAFLESAVVQIDRKSTRLNSSHVRISYAVFCLKKKITRTNNWFQNLKKHHDILTPILESTAVENILSVNA